MSPALIEDMAKALDDLLADDTIRALIITGAGKSFSAGGDVKEDLEPLQKMGPDEFNSYLEKNFVPFKRLMYSEKPAIAAVNGYAVGAGM